MADMIDRQRSVFPSDTAFLKTLYLSTFEATKEMDHAASKLGQVYGELRHVMLYIKQGLEAHAEPSAQSLS
jgi:hypothetical protein